jgi:hypothetical protein
MNAVIKLDGLVEALETCDETSELFVNRRSGELVLLGEEEIMAAEGGDHLEDFPEWRREAIALANEVLDSDDYVEMSAAHDIDNYELMRDFCESVDDRSVSARLSAAIRGRGAFRRFEQCVEELQLIEQWYAFRRAAYRRIAADWCAAHGCSCG